MIEMATFDGLMAEREYMRLSEGDGPAEEAYIVEGEIPGAVAPPYRCPNPTRWRLIGQAVRAKGAWMQVSSAVYAKEAEVRHTFRVARAITWGLTVEESLKGAWRLIEIELGVTLSVETRVTTSETVSYTIPKGRTMALFAAPGYVVRRFDRTAYGSAMCNAVQQTCRAHSPNTHFLKVDYV